MSYSFSQPEIEQSPLVLNILFILSVMLLCKLTLVLIRIKYGTLRSLSLANMSL